MKGVLCSCTLQLVTKRRGISRVCYMLLAQSQKLSTSKGAKRLTILASASCIAIHYTKDESRQPLYIYSSSSSGLTRETVDRRHDYIFDFRLAVFGIVRKSGDESHRAVPGLVAHKALHPLLFHMLCRGSYTAWRRNLSSKPKSQQGDQKLTLCVAVSWENGTGANVLTQHQ